MGFCTYVLGNFLSITITHQVRALVHNLPSHKETCSAALVWLLGTRSVQRVAYSTLRELALDGLLHVTQVRCSQDLLKSLCES